MKSIVIFNPYCRWDFHTNFEIPIYHNLVQRGYRVIYLRCGMVAEACDLHTVGSDGVIPENDCARCNARTDSILKNAGLEYKSLSDYLDQEPLAQMEFAINSMDAEGLRKLELFGLNLYDIAASSVHTYFRANRLDPKDSAHLNALRKFVSLSARVLVAGKSLLHEETPEAALIFNGRMSSTRAFLELCEQHGVKYATHERGLPKGYFRLNLQGNCLSLSSSDLIKQHLTAHPLKNYQIEMVRDWLEGRIKGNNQNWKNFLQNSNNQYAEANSSRSRWVMFTSSADEVSAHPIFNRPFGDQYAWIMTTCGIAETLDVELVIRVHPNSSGPNATGQNIEEYEFFERLSANKSYRNISVIKSDEPINSYNLAASADLVLVYVSTIAIESLLMGKRVYMAGNCAYNRCSGVYSPQNTPDYEAFLRDHHTKSQFNEIDRNNVVQSYRFMYHYLYTAHVCFPFVEQIDAHHNRINASDISDFDVGSYKELDHAVECILGKKQFMSVTSGYFSDEDLIRERECIFKIDSKEDHIRVSVVITNYNYAAYLSSCVESVIAQNRNDVQIVIVDDGSTDHSREVIEQLLADYPRENIRALYQENSGQPAIARNNGIAAASGKFILPLDADDMIAPGYIQSAIDIMENRPEVNLIYADSLHVYPDKEVRHPPGVFSPGRLSKKNQIVVASLYKKTLWEAAGGYKTNVRGYEDWDLWLNMSVNGAIPAYYSGIGLIYNAKDSGLYHEAEARHEKLYSQLVLNNQDAFFNQRETVKWAREAQARYE